MSFVRQTQSIPEEIQYVQIVFQGPCQLREDSGGKEVELVNQAVISIKGY